MLSSFVLLMNPVVDFVNFLLVPGTRSSKSSFKMFNYLVFNLSFAFICIFFFNHPFLVTLHV